MGYVSIVKLLLDRGADVSMQIGQSENALGAAIEAGSQDTVQLLLDHGAIVDTEAGYRDRHFDFTQLGNYATSKSLVMILELCAVVAKFRGGIEMDEALARKNFKRSVEIQMELGKEEEKRNS
ncbi:hypothetical protein N431DRAFT_143161 [Stipitochalara longipes BDJ]|nr:hypothetical protein N431DRAFT_143161 [Stipitochalara longipes BDJ]